MVKQKAIFMALVVLAMFGSASQAATNCKKHTINRISISQRFGKFWQKHKDVMPVMITGLTVLTLAGIFVLCYFGHKKYAAYKDNRPKPIRPFNLKNVFDVGLLSDEPEQPKEYANNIEKVRAALLLTAQNSDKFERLWLRRQKGTKGQEQSAFGFSMSGPQKIYVEPAAGLTPFFPNIKHCYQAWFDLVDNASTQAIDDELFRVSKVDGKVIVQGISFQFNPNTKAARIGLEEKKYEVAKVIASDLASKIKQAEKSWDNASKLSKELFAKVFPQEQVAS